MSEQLSYHQGSQQWIDFFSYWERDPIGMVNLCGHALGQNAMYTENFFSAFGRSLFTTWKIPERIEYLYENKQPTARKKKDFFDSIEIGTTDNIPWIVDIDGQYQNMGLALFRNLDVEKDTYAIRIFLPKRFEDDPPESTWNGPIDVLEGIIGDPSSKYPHLIIHGHTFWKFYHDEDGDIQIAGRSDGFNDIATTKRVAHMILWTSNMLGFSGDFR